MTDSQDDITGVLLAGGQSRRMGGGDKGLLAFGQGTMLGHVVSRFAPQVCKLVLNANGDPARFAAFELPVVADTVEGNVGPLAGVLTGMRWARENTPAARYVATALRTRLFYPSISSAGFGLPPMRRRAELRSRDQEDTCSR